MGALDGRTCIITGAGRGIGRAHALLFGREGAKVVVNDVSASADGSGSDGEAAEAVVDEIVSSGGAAVASMESVANWEGAQRIVNTAIEAFGDLHVVVNNAGILRDRALVSMTEEEFDAVVAVHLKGTFNVTRWAASYWREQTKAGRTASRAVINTSSGAGLHGNAGQTNYAAAKAGIAAMTIVNSLELERYGVKVNCIAPIARTSLVLATPGLGELVDKPEFDPGNVSPLVAALAAGDCPFNGQVFSACGNSVGIFAGWSLAQEITTDEAWTVEELRRAMDKLPRRVEVNSQLAKLTEAVQ